VAAYLTTAYDRAHLPSPSIDDDRLGEVGAAWMTQRIVRDAGPLLAWTVGILTLSVCLSFVWLGTRDDGFGGSIPLVSFAMWVVVAIPIVAVGLIRSSLSDRGRRREVGRLWDVLTFWPRVTHPFAPPCYGEALVPMLEDRVRLLLGATGDEVNLDDPPSSASSPSTSPPASPSSSPSSVPVEPLERNLGYRVILAGHSQGSVVALAVAARLEAEEGRAAMRRVALVSYGSPIAILYERYFRATLVPAEGEGISVYDGVKRAVHSWHHLFSLTEPFAFPFWKLGEEDLPRTDPAVIKGWPVNLRMRGADEPACPACEGDGSGVVVRCTEALVRDPDRWRLWDGTPVEATGHSVYHRHPDVDAHLARIARSLVGAGGPQGVRQDERRTERWWRTGV
jgi:pimeloyl-ACP methyl ester carboxylesterase